MPRTTGINISNLRPLSKSKKRFDKLLGKKSGTRSVTRSRLASQDFGTESELSCISTLQDLKRKKKTRLNHLKSQDMMLMGA